jgi:hypothetical protein
MNFWLKPTKVFAFTILFFASFTIIRAQDSIYKLPPGTKMILQMETEINSKVSSVNDTFTAKISKPVIVREQTVLPTGTIIEGRITKVERAASGGQSGKMEVKFETIKFPDGVKREIEGFLVNELKAESTATTSVLAVVGGTAIGALFGAVSKSDNGVLIGAGVGAGAGTGFALLRKGKNVRIKTSEEFEIELKKEVVLPVLDY